MKEVVSLLGKAGFSYKKKMETRKQAEAFKVKNIIKETKKVK